MMMIRRRCKRKSAADAAKALTGGTSRALGRAPAALNARSAGLPHPACTRASTSEPAHTAPPIPAPAAGLPAWFMPVRATGLMQRQHEPRKRRADAVREDPAGQCVVVIDDANAHQPRWRCMGCAVERTGGATRIVDILLGRKQTAICSGSDPSFLALLVKVRESEAQKKNKNQRNAAVAQVNEAASSRAVQPSTSNQPLPFPLPLPSRTRAML